MILVIDNYDSFTYNLVHLIQAAGDSVRVIRNDAEELDQLYHQLPDAIILSPGPGNPQTAGRSLEIIDRFGRLIPILGVCLGHQCIAEAFGGKTVPAKAPIHGKTDAVYHRQESLFHNLKSPFQVTRYHSLVVDRASLPTCLQITAETADHVIMGLRHRTLPLTGVQFHPEAILTEFGPDIIKNWLFSFKLNKLSAAL